MLGGLTGANIAAVARPCPPNTANSSAAAHLLPVVKLDSAITLGTHELAKKEKPKSAQKWLRHD